MIMIVTCQSGNSYYRYLECNKDYDFETKVINGNENE